ncbi:MAG TPA: hexose kinase [Longimicrobiales bacterium]|nr:hexose kinase [Longimicrobiales bacterium]
MIVTLTPNPSLDLLFETEQLVWDDANRLADPRWRAGGQGINVARAVRELGGDAVALALLGGRTGAELHDMLAAEGTPLRSERVAGETRTFAAVRETATGRSLLLNARGPARSRADAAALLELVERSLRELRPAWLACCGSLPAGFAPDFYLRAAELARSFGAAVVVDCDGAPLRAAAAQCGLLVPNRHEAERLSGVAITGMSGARDAAMRMIELGARRAAITLGEAGALLATADCVWLARAPAMQAGSAVGAGDAFLAALLLAHQLPEEESLRRAVAAGSAALLSRGTDLIRREDADRLMVGIEVERVA